jgi:hypothetical protein
MDIVEVEAFEVDDALEVFGEYGRYSSYSYSICDQGL